MSDTKKFTFIGVTEDLKTKFKALLKEFNIVATPVIPATQAAPVKKFGEAVLKDDTIIKWEGEMPLGVGVALLVIDPANPEGFLPMPDGDHELKDGSKITVEAGMVKVYTPAAAPVTPPPATDTAAVLQRIESEIAGLKSKFSEVEKDLTDKLNAEIEANKKLNEVLTNTVKNGFEIFALAMDTPTADPVDPPTGKVKKGIFEK